MNNDPRDKRSGNFEIAIIEDDPADFELMHELLTKAFPCQITHIQTKKEFENYLNKSSPDIIVSDSNVVNFDGYAALNLTLERCPKVPFIFCSGADDTMHADKGVFGIEWVRKDFGFKSLISAVSEKLTPRKQEE